MMKKLFVGSLFVALVTPGVSFSEEPAVAPAPEVVAEAVAPVEAPKNSEWKGTAGFNGLINTGNSSSETFGGDGLVSYKWFRNMFTFTANGSYGRAEVGGVKATNAKNWKTVLRYDRFITDPISLFALGHLGADTFAGFDRKYGSAAGVAHEIIKSDPHYFKYEFGFDYTRENRVVPPNQDLYSARTFFQYKLKINKVSTFGQDLEALFGLRHGKNVRLNSLTALTFKLTDVFGFQAGYEVRFHNQPVPGFKKVDTTTRLGIVATFI